MKNRRLEIMKRKFLSDKGMWLAAGFLLLVIVASIAVDYTGLRDVIISDGLVMPYNIVIGKNMAKQFKNVYMSAKKSGTLIKSL